MKKIRFRAWDKENKKMFEVREDRLLRELYARKNTMMQFTCLKDKNDEDIYEGDIIRLYNDEKKVGVVVFHKGGYAITGKLKVGNLDTSIIHLINSNESQREIIGNMFENKELVKFADTSAFNSSDILSITEQIH